MRLSIFSMPRSGSRDVSEAERQMRGKALIASYDINHVISCRVQGPNWKYSASLFAPGGVRCAHLSVKGNSSAYAVITCVRMGAI